MSTISFNASRDLLVSGLKRLGAHHPSAAPVLAAYLALAAKSQSAAGPALDLFIDLSDTLLTFCRRDRFYEGRTFLAILSDSQRLITDIDHFLTAYAQQGIFKRALKYKANHRAFKRIYQRLDMLDLRLRCIVKYRPIMRDYQRSSGQVDRITADGLGIITEEDKNLRQGSRGSLRRAGRARVQSLVSLPREEALEMPMRWGESPRASKKSLVSAGSTPLDISNASCRANRGESMLSLPPPGRCSTGSQTKDRSHRSSPLANPVVNHRRSEENTRPPWVEAERRNSMDYFVNNLARLSRMPGSAAVDHAREKVTRGFDADAVWKWLDEVQEPDDWDVDAVDKHEEQAGSIITASLPLVKTL